MTKFTFFERVVYLDDDEVANAIVSIDDDVVTINGNVIGIGAFKTEPVEDDETIETEVYRGRIR